MDSWEERVTRVTKRYESHIAQHAYRAQHGASGRIICLYFVQSRARRIWHHHRPRFGDGVRKRSRSSWPSRAGERDSDTATLHIQHAPPLRRPQSPPSPGTAFRVLIPLGYRAAIRVRYSYRTFTFIGAELARRETDERNCFAEGPFIQVNSTSRQGFKQGHGAPAYQQ